MFETQAGGSFFTPSLLHPPRAHKMGIWEAFCSTTASVRLSVHPSDLFHCSPTEHFTNIEPQNPSIVLFRLHKEELTERRILRHFKMFGSVYCLPDRHFCNFRASKSVDSQGLCTSKTRVTGFWSSKIGKGLVGWPLRQKTCWSAVRHVRK